MNFILVIVLNMVTCSLFSQDIIIKNNGERINCTILSEDSLYVSFMMIYNDKEINTYISKNEIKEIIYKNKIKTPNNIDTTQHSADYYRNKLIDYSIRKSFGSLLIVAGGIVASSGVNVVSTPILKPDNGALLFGTGISLMVIGAIITFTGSKKVAIYRMKLNNFSIKVSPDKIYLVYYF